MIKQPFNRWLKQRFPKNASQQLNKRNIFILPSRAGIAYLLITFAIFLLATNYENNLSLLLSYWLISVWIIILYLSYFNLSGLHCQAKAIQAVHAHDKIQLDIHLNSTKLRFDLNWQDEAQTHIKQLKPNLQLLKLNWTAPSRGVWQLPRIKLFSQAPLGLFTAFSYLDFNQQTLIYPKPLACPEYLAGTGKAGDKSDNYNIDHKMSGYDFQGLKNYQAGDALSRVAWKRITINQNWQIKQFDQPQSSQVWYAIQHISAQTHEDKLRKLTWLIIQAEAQGYQYGLQLNHTELPPAQGPDHLTQCLILLAKHP
ncbi:DUF58 domain-containing protein [Catenovulum adriaticum]|uniref:DUF58 domain-containing protein n=1 Tax=Catenovulum adriaticum TaxID=2984846 RepID=A0ABY7APC3_9ALTE|nr:DUF58 domain-containing protein [Catenovulum sp. TS8]WAJ71414.1 DUF58 domain-containing protein [Catenovulum sp. TS8]